MTESAVLAICVILAACTIVWSMLAHSGKKKHTYERVSEAQDVLIGAMMEHRDVGWVRGCTDKVRTACMCSLLVIFTMLAAFLASVL